MCGLFMLIFIIKQLRFIRIEKAKLPKKIVLTFEFREYNFMKLNAHADFITFQFSLCA